MVNLTKSETLAVSPRHGTCDQCQSVCNENLHFNGYRWICDTCARPTWLFTFSDEFASRTGIYQVTVGAGLDWFRDALSSVIHFAGMDCVSHIESVVDPRGRKNTIEITESGEAVPVLV